jgi:heterodisulfide reductase subunit A
MIQCVGSRCEERPYCSRVCCSEAIKNSLKLKEINPKVDIFVLYRDMRTYGFKEEYYKRAREAGVIFVRYDEDNKPEIVDSTGKKLRLQVSDPILKEDLCIDTDLLALSVATVPWGDNKKLAEMLKVPLNDDNFFLEAHVKLRPVEFATDGVFLCGLAHSPKFIEESIAQAQGAASRACTILNHEKILAEGIIASVNADICAGCGVCEALCPYSAIKVDEEEKVAKVNEALCKGCGTCCAACPSGAVQQRGFKGEQILSMVGAALG